MPYAADQVKFDQSYREGYWVVTAEVLPVEGAALPAHVFIYENLGTLSLGPYWGVCNSEELNRLQEWTGVELKKFGNRFVRHCVAEVIVKNDSTVSDVIARLTADLKALRDSITVETSSTKIVSIE